MGLELLFFSVCLPNTMTPVTGSAGATSASHSESESDDDDRSKQEEDDDAALESCCFFATAMAAIAAAVAFCTRSFISRFALSRSRMPAVCMAFCAAATASAFKAIGPVKGRRDRGCSSVSSTTGPNAAVRQSSHSLAVNWHTRQSRYRNRT